MIGHAVLAHVSRQERRLALKRADAARKRGDWGAWETIRFPQGTVSADPRDWSYGFDTVHRNAVFSVLDRVTPCGARHLAITSLSTVRPTWWEMQRIKNEIAGDKTTGVEVYPPQDEVVDGADMYHLWILPQPLDFGLRQVREHEA